MFGFILVLIIVYFACKFLEFTAVTDIYHNVWNWIVGKFKYFLNYPNVNNISKETKPIDETIKRNNFKDENVVNSTNSKVYKNDYVSNANTQSAYTQSKIYDSLFPSIVGGAIGSFLGSELSHSKSSNNNDDNYTSRSEPSYSPDTSYNSESYGTGSKSSWGSDSGFSSDSSSSSGD